MASHDQEQLSLQTIESLEGRLKQIEFYLTEGNPDALKSVKDASSGQSPELLLHARLQRLESEVAALTSESKAAADILQLHREHPRLFPSDLTANDGDAYTAAEKFEIVNSCASLLTNTASRLDLLKEIPVPPADSSASLTALHPQLAKVELQQDHWAEQIAKLRLKSALVLQRWVELSVLATNECWAEWEERLMEAEKIVRRHEAARAEELETV